MIKNFLVSTFALTLLVVTGFGISKSRSNTDAFSEITINNIEALANWEVVDPSNPGYESVSYYFCGDFDQYRMCHNCYGSGKLYCS